MYSLCDEQGETETGSLGWFSEATPSVQQNSIWTI